MLIYIFIYVVAIVFYLLKDEPQAKERFYLLAFMLILVLGFRGESVGRDTSSYHEIFDLINLNRESYINEYGYVLISKITNFIGGTVQLVFLFFAILTIVFFCRFILRYSTNPYMSLLIFIFVGPYYLASFNQMRQYLAIAVFLGYLLPLIEKRRFIQFLFGAVLTAFFSHITVLLTIPLYFVLKKRWDFMTKLLIVVGFMLGIKFLTILILASPYGYFILARSEIELETTMFILQIFIAVIILLFEKKVEKKKKMLRCFLIWLCYQS